MKKHLILFFAGVILSYGNIKAQTAPDKKEILKVTLQVNDYFMKKYADYRTPSFVKKVVRPSNIWTRSVYLRRLNGTLLHLSRRRILSLCQRMGGLPPMGLPPWDNHP